MEALDHTDAPSWSWLRSSDVKAAQPEGEGTKSPGADAESAEKLLPAEGERADQPHKYAQKLQKIAQDSEEEEVLSNFKAMTKLCMLSHEKMICSYY